jgi:hypothetical protein
MNQIGLPSSHAQVLSHIITAFSSFPILTTNDTSSWHPEAEESWDLSKPVCGISFYRIANTCHTKTKILCLLDFCTDPNGQHQGLCDVAKETFTRKCQG